MTTALARSLIVSLLLAAPAAGQRPPLTAQVKPAALAAARLQVLRLEPGGAATPGAGSEAAATPPTQRTPFLTTQARRELLARSGVQGAPANEVLRVQPAEPPSLVSVQMESADLVGNRSGGQFGPTVYMPFARFPHTSEHSTDGVSVRVRPGGAARYLVECEVSGMRDFNVSSGSARMRFTNVSQPGTTGHLSFLVERFDANTDAGFRITAGMVGTWAFYGCELTPIS